MPDFYGTVADADTYHSARGNAAWAGDDTAKTAALLRASAYVDGLGIAPDGRPLWPGVKTGARGQLRSWPRVGAQDIDGNAIDPITVPIEVQHATYEAALRELVEPGSLSPDYTPGTQVKREKVDVLEVEYQTVAATAPGINPTRPVVTVVLELLAPVMLADCMGSWIAVV